MFSGLMKTFLLNIVRVFVLTTYKEVVRKHFMERLRKESKMELVVYLHDLFQQ